MYMPFPEEKGSLPAVTRGRAGDRRSDQDLSWQGRSDRQRTQTHRLVPSTLPVSCARSHLCRSPEQPADWTPSCRSAKSSGEHACQPLSRKLESRAVQLGRPFLCPVLAALLPMFNRPNESRSRACMRCLVWRAYEKNSGRCARPRRSGGRMMRLVMDDSDSLAAGHAAAAALGFFHCCRCGAPRRTERDELFFVPYLWLARAGTTSIPGSALPLPKRKGPLRWGPWSRALR